MNLQVGIAVLALIVGLVGGVALVGLRRPRSEDRAPSTSHSEQALAEQALAEQALAATRIQGQLESQAAELRRIADATAGRDAAGLQVREGLEAARRALEQLQVREQERRHVEEEHRDVVRRLSTVLAGGASKGRAGENLLHEHLRQLPPGMLITDFRVGGKVVEFGLRLPDGRCLPVDSKWTALAELETLQAADEPAAREAGVRAVERAVVLRAREVAQYLDPALTAPVAVAAVPDAAYEVLRRAHADAFGCGVVIVPYGSALPIVLFLYALVQRFGDASDVQAGLAEVAGVLDVLETVVENKFARAGTMIANGSEEFRSQLGKARGSIARARQRPPGDRPTAADPAPSPSCVESMMHAVPMERAIGRRRRSWALVVVSTLVDRRCEPGCGWRGGSRRPGVPDRAPSAFAARAGGVSRLLRPGPADQLAMAAAVPRRHHHRRGPLRRRRLQREGVAREPAPRRRSEGRLLLQRGILGELAPGQARFPRGRPGPLERVARGEVARHPPPRHPAARS